MRVTTNHRDTWHGQTKLGADNVNNTLVLIPQRMQSDAKLGGVLAKRFNLGARGQISNWLVDIDGWSVVIFGGDCEIWSTYLAASKS